MSKPKTARVFRSGGSQAVRLPREFRVETDEVLIRREGGRLVLESPRSTWSDAFRALAGSAPAFPYPAKRRRPGRGPELD